MDSRRPAIVVDVVEDAAAHTGAPVSLQAATQASLTSFLQRRRAFLRQRFALPRGALGHAAAAASVQVVTSSAHAAAHARHALGVLAAAGQAARASTVTRRAMRMAWISNAAPRPQSHRPCGARCCSAGRRHRRGPVSTD
jgi:hypothetical protein